MLCLFKSCGKCGGDLLRDDLDWRCCQCGHYYYGPRTGDDRNLNGQHDMPDRQKGEVFPRDPYEPERDKAIGVANESADRGRRRGYGARSARNINALIQSKTVGEVRWWDRNKEIIDALNQGLSVRDISGKIGCGQRKVRAVRERLTDTTGQVVEVAIDSD